jgi:enoyl-CoA hydratase/carnithine racemase
MVWTLSRPESRNALDFATLGALGDAARSAGTDRAVRAVVLTGEGGTFASGGDLRELRNEVSRDGGERLLRAGRSATTAIAELRVPVLAALPGPAIGGGAELAVACDLRIADVGARIGFRHARMGVTTAWGATERLVALVGVGVAARLLLVGHEVSAGEAYAFGLVDAVVESGACVSQALAWAYDIAAGAPEAVARAKAMLRRATRAPWEAADLEARHFVDAWASDDHGEAVAAYFERRPPVWK